MPVEDDRRESGNSGGSQTVAYDRRALAALVFSAVVFQGLTINLMPVTMGAVSEAFDVRLRGQEGLLQTLFLSGGVVSLALSGWVTEMAGPVRSASIGVFSMAAGLVLFGTASSYWQVLVSAALIGAGNLWMLAPYSAVITQSFPAIRSKMFMWASAAFAFSATLGNVTVGYLLSVAENWGWIFVGLGIAIAGWFAALVWYLRSSVSAPQATDAESSMALALDPPLSRLQNATASLIACLFNSPLLWLLGFLVMLDSLTGGNMVTWTGRYFQDEFAIGHDKVGAMIGASSFGVFVGRLILATFVSGRFSDLIVLGVCYAGAVLTYGLLLLAPNYPTGVFMFFVASALLSAQAPTMYSIASAKFGARAATAIPLIDGIGILGSLVGPTALGLLADQSDLHTALWVVPATGMLFVLIVGVWAFLERTRSPTLEKS